MKSQSEKTSPQDGCASRNATAARGTSGPQRRRRGGAPRSGAVRVWTSRLELPAPPRFVAHGRRANPRVGEVGLDDSGPRTRFPGRSRRSSAATPWNVWPSTHSIASARKAAVRASGCRRRRPRPALHGHRPQPRDGARARRRPEEGLVDLAGREQVLDLLQPREPPREEVVLGESRRERRPRAAAARPSSASQSQRNPGSSLLDLRRTRRGSCAGRRLARRR